MRLTNQKGENLSPAEMKKSAGNYFKIGLAIVAVGLIFLAWNYAYILTTTSAEGTVVSIEYSTTTSRTNSSTGAKTPTYLPTFSFQDKAGVPHEAPIRFAESVQYKVGDTYNIGYDPDDLSIVFLTDWGSNIKFPLIFFVIAGGVFWMSSSIRKTGREWEAAEKNG